MTLPTNDDDVFIALDPDQAPGDGDGQARPLDVAFEWAIRSQHRALQRTGPSVSADLERRDVVTSANFGTIWRCPYIFFPDTDQIRVSVTFKHLARQQDMEAENAIDMEMRVRTYVPGRGPLDGQTLVPLDTHIDGQGTLQWLKFQVPVDVDRTTIGYVHLDYSAHLYEETRTEVVGTEAQSADEQDSRDPRFYETGQVQPPEPDPTGANPWQDYPNGANYALEMLETTAFSNQIWEIGATIRNGNGEDQTEKWVAQQIQPWVDKFSGGERAGADRRTAVQIDHVPLTWVDLHSVEVHEDRADTDDIDESAIQRAIPIDASFSSWQHARESREVWSRDRLTVLPDVSADAPEETAPRDTWRWLEKGMSVDVCDSTCRLRMEQADSTPSMLLRWSLLAGYTIIRNADQTGIDSIIDEAGEIRVDYTATVEQLEDLVDADWSDAKTVGTETWTDTTRLFVTYPVGVAPILQTLFYGNTANFLSTIDLFPIDDNLYREGVLYPRDLGLLDVQSRQITLDNAAYDTEYPVRVRMSAELSDVTDRPEGVEVINDGLVRGVVTDVSGYLSKPGSVL